MDHLISTRRIECFFLVFCLIFISSSCSKEARSWRESKQTNTSAAFQGYLQKYPQGAHAGQAREALGKILWQENKPIWEAEKDISTLPARYREFVAAFPENPFLQDARKDIESIAYTKAEAAGSLERYQAFLVSFGDSLLAEKARRKIEAFIAERGESFKDAKTASVSVRQSYGEAKDYQIHIKDTLECLLRSAGLMIAEGKGQEVDCRVELDIKGTPLRANYGSAGDLYTGARIEAALAVNHRAGLFRRLTFSATRKPTQRILITNNDFPRTPSKAPFWEALVIGTDFASRTVETLVDAFGRSLLESACQEEDSLIQEGILRYVFQKWFAGEPWADDWILKVCQSGSPWLKARIIEGIDRQGYPSKSRVVEVMMAALQDTQSDHRANVRETAVNTIFRRKIWDEKIIALLRGILDKESGPDSNSLRYTIVWDLGFDTLEKEKAVDILISVLQKEKDSNVLERAAQSLKDITGQDFGLDFVKWESWRKK